MNYITRHSVTISSASAKQETVRGYCPEMFNNIWDNRRVLEVGDDQ